MDSIIEEKKCTPPPSSKKKVALKTTPIQVECCPPGNLVPRLEASLHYSPVPGVQSTVSSMEQK